MLHPTIHHVLEHANLISAWEKVRANKGCAGTDGITIEEFESRLEDNLNQLKREVLDRSYRPRPLLRIDIPKKDGKFRSLSIPTVRDRVLQTAVAKVLEPALLRQRLCKVADLSEDQIRYYQLCPRDMKRIAIIQDTLLIRPSKLGILIHAADGLE